MQTIVTHNGSFDPDDVFATATVSLFLGENNYEIIRSRDQDVINKADWVLDVGGKYNPDAKRFDHHQNGVPQRDNNVPYAAFGLVWLELGEKVCGSAFIAKQIEEKLVQPVDAADNQVSLCEIHSSGISPFEIFDVINMYKPVWGSDENYDIGFYRAVSFARNLLRRVIAQELGNENMRALVASVIDPSNNKELLVFDVPVSRSVVADFNHVKVVVSPSIDSSESNWMAAAVPVKNGSLNNRATFKSEWAGLSYGDLEEVSGIKGAIFCHKELYIFVAKTKEAALRAASEIINS